MSDAEKRLADEAHRHGLPTFLLRLRKDAGDTGKPTVWRPTHRRD